VLIDDNTNKYYEGLQIGHSSGFGGGAQLPPYFGLKRGNDRKKKRQQGK